MLKDMMDNAQVLHASHDGIHVLRFVGDVRYPLAPSIERFIDELFGRCVPAGIIVDLSETYHIDSTSLGVLGRIANRMRACNGPRVTIVSPRDAVSEVLTSMGFDEVFDIVTRPGASLAGEVQALPLEEPSRDTMEHTVIEAHRTLMALNEHNREVFRDLVMAMEQRVKSRG